MAVATACRQWGQVVTNFGIGRFREFGALTSVYDPLSVSLASVCTYRKFDCR